MIDCWINVPGLHGPQGLCHQSLLRALDAYRRYADSAINTFIEPRRQLFEQLPHDRQQLLKDTVQYQELLDAIEYSILCNARIASSIYEFGVTTFQTAIPPEGAWRGCATEFDCSIVRSCIRALFRDWSQEAKQERQSAHLPILTSLHNEFGSRFDKKDLRILVPGAGLGRLVRSISDQGFSVEGNDISYHMLLARMYIFSRQLESTQQELYPWAMSFSNHVSRKDQLQKVKIPDLCSSGHIRIGVPAETKEKNIVFAEGEFAAKYASEQYANHFSALATCYFIDTAKNFLDYVDAAYICLREGGIWINTGPLLWNAEENGPAGNGEGDRDEQEALKFEDVQSSTSTLLELSSEEVLLILGKRGFVVERFVHNISSAPYVGNRASMLQYSYRMAFWVARKQRRSKL